VDVPLNVLAATVSVRVLPPFPGDAMLKGVNVAVTPFGNRLTDSAMADLNPFIAIAFNPIAVELPEVTVALAEFAVSAKVGTTTVTLRF